MQVLKVVDLKDALNHRGKAVVITPGLNEMYDISDFGQDFSFLCKPEGQAATMMSIKEAFNYKGDGLVRAISPDMTETMTLEEFRDGFYFLILTNEREVDERQATRRSSRKLIKSEEEIGEDEIDVTYDD